MDSYYLRLRRRRRLLRAAAVCAFFAVISLPLLYLLRGEIRGAAATVYRYAQSELQAAPATPTPQAVQAAPTAAVAAPSAVSSPKPEAAPQVVAQAQPAPQRPPAPRVRTAKLGETAFRIPEGYVEGNADLGSSKDPLIVLRALLPDLRPRAEGRGGCAPKQIACGDFAIIKLRPARRPLESEFSKRYKTEPTAIALIPGVHGLRQIPPHKALPSDGRQFLAQPGGRWVWITCRDFGRPSPKQPASGICQLDFDSTDGLAVRVRFDRAKLADWSAIHAKTLELIARLKG